MFLSPNRQIFIAFFRSETILKYRDSNVRFETFCLKTEIISILFIVPMFVYVLTVRYAQMASFRILQLDHLPKTSCLCFFFTIMS